MIQRPVFGKWVVITPEFGSQNIIIQYSDPTVNPPLPALLTLEPHVPSTDRSDEELQFEEIRLTWSTSHPTINPPNRQNTKNTKMLHHHSVHIPIYEGEEDPGCHWFICERMWDATDVTDEDKQITQFAGTLRKIALTLYMNFMENQNRSKAKIKASVLAFFKTEDVAHLAAQKLTDIKQMPGE